MKSTISSIAAMAALVGLAQSACTEISQYLAIVTRYLAYLMFHLQVAIGIATRFPKSL